METVCQWDDQIGQSVPQMVPETHLTLETLVGAAFGLCCTWLNAPKVTERPLSGTT